MPDFRLAPEHAYPDPLEDCSAGLTRVSEHAAGLGADPERIAVDGRSGGGGLAAGLTPLARDRDAPHLYFQYLAFPEIDDRLPTKSMNQLVGIPLIDRANMRASCVNCLGDFEPGYDQPAGLPDVRRFWSSFTPHGRFSDG